MTYATERSAALATLLDMISYRRPAGSRTERRWIREYLEPLGVVRDGAGNLIKRIGTAPVLWSAHTDTVHKTGGRQRVRFLNDVASLADAKSNCLGADNTAGVWLLREMILANVPGLYVFHREEECGGVGSGHIAARTPTLLDGITAAVAFDRRGTKSVITHQWGGRSCSDAFATSLADALGLGHKPDDGGTFTDTANYTDLIGECSNVSAGFAHEHSRNETLDVAYLFSLRDALLSADTSRLAIVRRPAEIDPDDYALDWSRRRYTESDFRDAQGGWAWDDDEADRQPQTVKGVLQAYPDEVADYLEDYGWDAVELLRAVAERRLGHWQRGT
jgi:hypothetical protein